MKQWFLVLVSFFSFAALVAQPLRYTSGIFGKVDTLLAVQYAVAPALNKPIVLLSDYNIHEGEAATQERPLLMDIYQPRGDTLSLRPAVIFAHSGAFLLGSRLNDDMVALCDSFARRGYVTASIDYRLGMGANVVKIFGVIINVAVTKTNANRAVYRGVQDGRSAIKFLKQNAETYRIDTTKIFLVGSSSGAFVALHNLYFNKTENLPAEVFAVPSLGGLDTFGANGFGGTASGVVSYWGAAENVNLIQTDNTPVFLVHGKADKIVPFKKGIPLEGNVSPNPLVSLTMPETYGSYCIDSALTSNNIFHETYFVEGKGHEFYGCNTGEFPDSGPNIYWDTIIAKTSEFLFDRFKPTANFDVNMDGLTAAFTNLSSSSTQVEWDFGDGSKSKESNPVHLFSEPGQYTVRLMVINKNLASDTLSKIINVANTGVTENFDRIQVIYPNPTKSLIFIEGLVTKSDIFVYDLTGTRLLEFSKVENKKVDVSSLHSGVYILEINTEGKKVIWKFVKSN